MQSYKIVDEPGAGRWQHIIVNPHGILLVAIMLPFFWRPPLMGQVWMPLLWVGLNGVFLGSPTLRREFAVIAGGVAMYVATLAAAVYVRNHGDLAEPDRIWPYVRILLQAVFFITLYLVVFMQSAPYAIHEYVKEQAAR
jgi:hypothetical protein